MDVLFPTQDQIAVVVSLAAGRLRTAGLATAVPEFAALAQVLRPGCGGTGGRRERDRRDRHLLWCLSGFRAGRPGNVV